MADGGTVPAGTEGGRAAPGSVRAAAVLLSLGPDVATQVFRLLDEDEVRRIASDRKSVV